MPSWGEVLNEIQGMRNLNALDAVRHKYLDILHKYTERNVVAYYSGFLQRPTGDVGIDDNDKNALMQVVYGLDKSKGLDLILHTPGGNIAACESIVTYLRSLFGADIRAIVPQMAMSAGTMIALSCKEIVMGKQSNIGPIDPQFGGISCGGVLEEFDRAIKDANSNPGSIPLWQVIISKYHPTFLGDCEKAIAWSKSMVQKWLATNMFAAEPNPSQMAQKVVEQLAHHEKTLSHGRHIHIDECRSLGIKAVALESLDKRRIDRCNDFQDCVLTVHHAYMHAFSNSTAVKIVENHLGNAMIIMQVAQGNAGR